MKQVLDLDVVANSNVKIVCLGSQKKIIQSILDFDYLSGKDSPSVVGIVSSTHKSERYFFGNKERLIPVFNEVSNAPLDATYLLNLSSSRRVLVNTKNALKHLPNLIGCVIFAEGVPERHSLELIDLSKKHSVWISGPASVGLIIPGIIKLGAIGGIDHNQISGNHLMDRGNIAVLSSSGGMTNELINIVANSSGGLSFAMSFGGELFPITSPRDAFIAAQRDKNTKTIVYFGELGGNDEYDIVDLIKSKLITKPIISYIAGSVSTLFQEPPQFGHAKSIARSIDESATAKRSALKKVGVTAPDSFGSFYNEIKKLDFVKSNKKRKQRIINENRKSALIASNISSLNSSGDLLLVGNKLEELADKDFGELVATMLLGQKINSEKTSDFIETSIKLLADHGPNVSGAMNTIISARAGKDLVSSLASGLLTIGPRFGGAVNEAARNWLIGVGENIPANVFVETMSKDKKIIQGIGHKKYRLDNPDPRMKIILDKRTINARYIKYALEIEAITTQKSGNLILNVDGAIAAAFLDILEDCENYTQKSLMHLVEIEFFNALFVVARTIGFTSHYLDQKRIDEGLLRLGDDNISYL